MNKGVIKGISKMIDGAKIPELQKAGLKMFVFDGIIPGGFLTSILCNDFVGSVISADSENLNCLRDYAVLLYNYIPENSFGSKEKVTEWRGLRNIQINGERL